MIAKGQAPHSQPPNLKMRPIAKFHSEHDWLRGFRRNIGLNDLFCGKTDEFLGIWRAYGFYWSDF